jgi:hypothetical protein
MPIAPLPIFPSLFRASSVSSCPVIGLKLAIGLGFLLSYAYDIYFLGLLWLIGVSAYLFALILFDSPEHPE